MKVFYKINFLQHRKVYPPCFLRKQSRGTAKIAWKLSLKAIFLIFWLAVILHPTFASGQLFFDKNFLIEKQAPEFTLPTIKGEKKSFKEFRNGKNAIIFFWATWCPHCRRQLGILKDKKDELKEGNIELILIDIGEEASQVKAFLDKMDVPFEVFLDLDSSLSETYNVVGVPALFFVNQEGIIKAMEYALPENYENIFN